MVTYEKAVIFHCQENLSLKWEYYLQCRRNLWCKR